MVDVMTEELPTLSKRDVAEILQCGLSTVDQYRRNGYLPSYKAASSAQPRFKLSDVAKLFRPIESKTKGESCR